MNKTSIAWTDYTSNPIRARNIETGKTGHYCTHVSEGCENCYAGVMNKTARFVGTGLDFVAQNRDKVDVYLNEAELREWAKPKYAGAKVFVCDMTDWCHELVTDEMIASLLNAFAAAPAVKFQLLTKRPERMRQILQTLAHNSELLDIPFWPLPNVWLGVTAENQRWADERIPVLLDTPAAVRFVSYEPALGPVDFGLGFWVRVKGGVRSEIPGRALSVAGGIHRAEFNDFGAASVNGLGLKPSEFERIGQVDWVIVGGESGANARPFDADWARSVRNHCAGAGAAFFMKQLGGKRFPDDSLESLPEDLRVREFPS